MDNLTTDWTFILQGIFINIQCLYYEVNISSKTKVCIFKLPWATITLFIEFLTSLITL